MRVTKHSKLSAGTIPLGNTGGEFTYDKLVDMVQYLAEMALVFGGILAMGAVIFYGFQMAISNGEPGKFTAAKESLIKAAIGAALIFGVFTIIRTIEGAANSITN